MKKRAIVGIMLYMTDYKIVIANNLTIYRKQAKLTQQELAEKLNYTDKAVSKWERGEAIPDVLVLKQIADLYGIALDDFFREIPQEKQVKTVDSQKRRNIKHLLITLLSALLVWLVATVIVVFVKLFAPEVPIGYYAYLSAIPVTFIVLLVFNALWGKMLASALIVSALVWTLCLCFHLFLQISNSWLVYIIGAVMQALIILWYLLQYVRKKNKRKL